MNELKVKNGLIVEGPITAPEITSSLFGTASFAVSASWAPTITAVASASWASQSLSASHADVSDSSSFASTATSASHANVADTSSYAFVAISASFATTASYVPTSSYAVSSSTAISSSYAFNATTASYVNGVVESSSYAATASVLSGFNFEASSSISVVTASNNIVISKSTGSFIAAFFDYAVASGSNIRAGTVFGSWVNGTATYSEFTTVDVGDTSQVTMSLVITGSNVRLLSNAANSVSWSVKAIARYL